MVMTEPQPNGAIQGYITYKKTHPPRTLPLAYAQGPRRVLGGWALTELVPHGAAARSHVPSAPHTHIIRSGAQRESYVGRNPLMTTCGVEHIIRSTPQVVGLHQVAHPPLM
jgi:hypothetical protein